jgi:hypothetical protein
VLGAHLVAEVGPVDAASAGAGGGGSGPAGGAPAGGSGASSGHSGSRPLCLSCEGSCSACSSWMKHCYRAAVLPWHPAGTYQQRPAAVKRRAGSARARAHLALKISQPSIFNISCRSEQTCAQGRKTSRTACLIARSTSPGRACLHAAAACMPRRAMTSPRHAPQRHPAAAPRSAGRTLLVAVAVRATSGTAGNCCLRMPKSL